MPSDAAKDLETPAGIVGREREGIITHRTERRQELLDRLAADPEDPGYTPPDQVLPDDRNKHAYEEQHATDRLGEQA